MPWTSLILNETCLFLDCDCHPMGTTDDTCNYETGQCICKNGIGGPKCDQCKPGFFNFPTVPWKTCKPCNCSGLGSVSSECNPENGQCQCKSSFSGKKCDQCNGQPPNGISFPNCPIVEP